MFLHLTNREDIFFLIVNLVTIFYAFFEIYRFGNEHNVQETSYGMTNGWNILNRKRMAFDFEYMKFFSYTSSNLCWLICHCFICEIMRFIDARRVPMIHAVFGVIYLLFMYKLPIVFLSMTMLFTFYMAMKTARKYIIFITLFSWLGIQGLFEMANQSHLLFGILTEDDYFRGLIMMYWLMMRLASFALQYCDEFIDPKKSLEKIRQRFSLINLLGFSYYLPVLTLGLPLLFSRYANVLGENELRKNGNLSIRIKILIIELFRIIMTGFIAVLMMHYIYTNPIYHDEYLVHELSGWPIYGMILSIMMYFCLIHMMKYQLCGAFSQFDRITSSSKPKCGLRVHGSTFMWRNLDTGMYDFLVRHIYIPTANLQTNWNKFGRVFVFVFVTIWHCLGNRLYILFWVWGNFTLLTLEDMGKSTMTLNCFNRISNFIGLRNMARIKTLLGSQLLIFLYCWCMLFACGPTVFFHILRETYLKSTLTYFILSVATYSLYHNSQRILEYEKLHSKKSQ